MLSVIALSVSWRVLLIKNPFQLTVIFFFVLFTLSYTVGCLSKFLGFIIFIVYVGGVMVLLAYCVILLPTSKYNWTQGISTATPFLFLLLSPIHLQNPSAYSYGLLFNVNTILLAALLLYLVILRIVGIIDYSSGMMKIYDQYKDLYLSDYNFEMLLPLSIITFLPYNDGFIKV